jgi:hypothetical protein
MVMDRQTLMMAGVVVCLACCLYLYKENQKQRTELQSFTERVTTQLNRAPVNEEKPRKVVFKQKVEEVMDEDKTEE